MSCSKCGSTNDVKQVRLTDLTRKAILVFLCSICISSGIAHGMEGLPHHPETPHETTRPSSTYNVDSFDVGEASSFASEVSGDSSV